jgi:hypothetical protein
MPRIAASLSVLALMACSIAVNIWRYPVVGGRRCPGGVPVLLSATRGAV